MLFFPLPFFLSSSLLHVSRAQEKQTPRTPLWLCPTHPSPLLQAINAADGADAPSPSAPAPLALGSVCPSRRRRCQGDPSVDRRLRAGDG